jgi:hypothetical protein
MCYGVFYRLNFKFRVTSLLLNELTWNFHGSFHTLETSEQELYAGGGTKLHV